MFLQLKKKKKRKNMEIKTLSTGSNGNCYYISDGSTNIIIECGISFKSIIKNIDLKKIKACIISHKHSDHAKSLRSMKKFGVDCYMARNTKKALWKNGWEKLPGRFIIFKNNTVFKVGSFEINTFSLAHSVPNTGFLIRSNILNQKLLFVTDTVRVNSWDKKEILVFSNLNYIMLESNYCEKRLKENEAKGVVNKYQAATSRDSHMEIQTAIKFLKSQDLSFLKEMHMLHLSEKNACPLEFSQRIGEVVKSNIFYKNKIYKKRGG
jgi:phosphoribosyl 1,2-cyclic phosphodiesterase